MNTLQTEFYPDDPERLPPARRRRARRLLAPLDADERAEFLDRLARRSSPTFDFFLFSLVSGAVISAGFVIDSPALLVLGAVLAPVMAPAVGLALGVVIGSAKYFLLSLAGLLVGGLLAFASGAMAGFLAFLWPQAKMSLVNLHTQFSWQTILVLAVGALATSALMAHYERSPNAPSVALAYALYVPLTAAGYGLGSNAPLLAQNGSVLFLIHIAVAVLLGALTLAVMGFRPLTLFGYTFGGAIVLLSIVALAALSGGAAVIGANVGLPTSTPTLTLTVTPVPPTFTPTATQPPPTLTPTLTPTATQPPPSQTPTLTLTPAPPPVYALVDSPEGANLRIAPGRESSIVTAVLPGTLVQVYPEIQEINGEIWVHVVVVETGAEGWMLQTVLTAATPAPNW